MALQSPPISVLNPATIASPRLLVLVIAVCLLLTSVDSFSPRHYSTSHDLANLLLLVGKSSRLPSEVGTTLSGGLHSLSAATTTIAALSATRFGDGAYGHYERNRWCEIGSASVDRSSSSSSSSRRRLRRVDTHSSRGAMSRHPLRLRFKRKSSTGGSDEYDDDYSTSMIRMASSEDGDTTLSSSSFLSLLPLLMPLLLVYISNQWSRSSLYYLVNFSDSNSVSAFTSMNVDLSFSEAQYGLLASVAFTALFAIASLVAGNLSDRFDRKLLTVGSAMAWSVATFGTAVATGYGQVLAARVFMGLACAFATPSAYTLIRDLVPKERTALANSVYGSGVYFGGALASLSILLDENLGWRGALVAIGSYGIAAAVLAFAVLPPDPSYDKRNSTGRDDGESVVKVVDKVDMAAPSLLDDASNVLSTSIVRWLFLGSFLRFCSGLCIGVWSAPYFRLAFPDDASSYAVINALIVGLCGVASGVGGGWASDQAGAAAANAGRDEKVGILLVPVAGSALAAPAWWMTVHAPTFESAMTWLAVEYLVAECWFGPIIAVLQSKVEKGKGGTAQGMFTLTGAIGNLAPTVLGALYGQATAQGAENGPALSSLLGFAVCAGYVLSSMCFTLCAQAVDSERSSLPSEGV